MQNNLMYVPGQQFRNFEVYRREAATDAKGRSLPSAETRIGSIKGSISDANQREVEKYKQMGYPITHTIVVQLKCNVKANDVLVRDGVRYYVKGVNNPAYLNFYTIIHCECKEGE